MISKHNGVTPVERGKKIVPKVRVIKVPQEPSTPVEVQNEPVQTQADQTTPTVTADKAVTLSRNTLIVISFCILAVFVLLIGTRNNNNGAVQSAQTTTPSTPATGADAESEAKKLHQEVSKLADLPDQTPSLVTVTDVDKLAAKSPVLFKNARNGDVVLFYVNADKTGRAVLYRPATKKIIALVDGASVGATTQSTNGQ